MPEANPILQGAEKFALHYENATMAQTIMFFGKYFLDNYPQVDNAVAAFPVLTQISKTFVLSIWVDLKTTAPATGPLSHRDFFYRPKSAQLIPSMVFPNPSARLALLEEREGRNELGLITMFIVCGRICFSRCRPVDIAWLMEPYGENAEKRLVRCQEEE